MLTYEKFWRAIIDSKLTVNSLGTPSTSFPRSDGISPFSGRKKDVLLVFSARDYENMYALLQEHKKNAPDKVRNAFVDPGQIEQSFENDIRNRAQTVARRVYQSVVVPWPAMVSLMAWLTGKEGRKGIAARNAIERKLFPQPESPKGDSAPPPQSERKRTFVPKQPSISDEELRSLGLARLKGLFDIVVVSVYAMPALDEFETLRADGKNADELYESGGEELPTIWVLRDLNDFHAVLIGPAYASEYERRVKLSLSSFRLPSISSSGLRTCRDLRKQLHRSGATFGDGMALVTNHDKAVGSLLSLSVLIKVLGLDKLPATKGKRKRR